MSLPHLCFPNISKIAARLTLSVAPIILACSLATGCAPDQEPNRPNRQVQPVAARHVVVLVLDATNAAHLGSYGGLEQTSPNIDALAARGVRFDHAYSNATWTLCSTTTLFTGRLPEEHGVLTMNDRPPQEIPLISELLGGVGWRTTSLVEMPFASAAFGLGRGFDRARHLSPNEPNPAEPDYNKRLRTHVMGPVRALGDTPSFHYIHLRFPHAPWDPSAEMRAAFEDGCLSAEALPKMDSFRKLKPHVDLEHVLHLYRASLRQSDALVGEVVKLLGDRLSTDTYLVITSDHGEGMGERGFYGHGLKVFDENLRIPLVIVGPGLAPRVVEQPVSTIDVLPTLLELAGAARPPDLDGTSLVPWMLAPEGGGPTPPVISVSRCLEGIVPSVAVTDGPYRLMLEGDGSVHLFHLYDDPGELRDIAAEHPKITSRLLTLAGPRQQSCRPGASTTGTEEMDDELRQRLMELGYLR